MIWLVLSSVLVLVRCSGQAPELLFDRSPEQLISNKECGLNAMYLMLRMNGLSVSHEDVRCAVKVGSNGSSLAELKHGASRLGFDLGIYKCDLEQLRTFEKPIIVLIHDGGGRMVVEEREPGHYITLTKYDSVRKQIVGIDGSYGNIRKFSEFRFQKKWTGYVLKLKKTESTHLNEKVFVAVSLLFWTVAFWLAGPKTNKGAHLKRAQAG